MLKPTEYKQHDRPEAHQELAGYLLRCKSSPHRYTDQDIAENTSGKGFWKSLIHSRQCGCHHLFSKPAIIESRDSGIYYHHCHKGSTDKIARKYEEPVLQHFCQFNLLFQKRDNDQVISGKQLTSGDQHHRHTGREYTGT